MKKKIRNIILTSSLALGVITAPSIANINNISNLNNTKSETLLNNNVQRATNLNYDAIFSSRTTEGQSSAGGVFGSDGSKNIYLTTYNNALAWNKNVTEHAVFTSSSSAVTGFDKNSATIKSMKVIERNWGSSTKEILYVLLQDSSKNSCVIPYDAVSGEDIITVTNVDGTIDWKENCFVFKKNDTLMYSEYLHTFYAYRYDNVGNYATDKITAFYHEYGKGFGESNVQQSNWSTMFGIDPDSAMNMTNRDSNILVAIIPTNSKYNTIIYYDKSISKEKANAAGMDWVRDQGLNALVVDNNMNVVQKPTTATCGVLSVGQSFDMESNANTPGAGDGGHFLVQYGYNVKTTSSSSSYSAYLTGTNHNNIMLYEVNNQTGAISVKSGIGIQEGRKLRPGQSATTMNDIDIRFSSYDEANKIFYLSCTWVSGVGNSRGKSVMGVKIDDNFVLQEPFAIDTTNDGTSGNYNVLKYAITAYKGDSSYKGPICSSSSESGSNVAKNVMVSLFSTDNSTYTKISNTNRGEFTDFQTVANEIWNTNSKNSTPLWASDITDSMILDNSSSTSTGFIRPSNNEIVSNTSFKVSDKVYNDEKGTLQFVLNMTSQKTNVSLPTNSKIYINLNGFRTLGNNYDLVDIDKTDPTNTEIQSRKDLLNLWKQTRLASQIKKSDIVSGYEDTQKNKTSPFWYAESSSFYNDIYSQSVIASKPLEDRISNLTANDNNGTLSFDVDFTDVTPKGKMPSSGKNIKSFSISGFAEQNNFNISVTNSVSSNKLVSQIDVRFIVENFIDKTKAGSAIVFSGLSITNDKLQLLDAQKVPRWIMEVNANNNTNIYNTNSIPQFTLYYNLGDPNAADPTVINDSRLVKVIAPGSNNNLVYNNNTTGQVGKDQDTTNWPQLNNIKFTNIYSKFIETQSPILSAYKVPSGEDEIVKNTLGDGYNKDKTTTFTTYDLDQDVSPKTLWDNMSKNSTSATESIVLPNIISVSRIPSSQFTNDKIVYLDGNSNENEFINKIKTEDGKLIVWCINSENLGSDSDNIDVNDKGINQYYSTNGVPKDNYLNLRIAFSNGSETDISNQEIGFTDAGNFKINYTNFGESNYNKYFSWKDIKIVKTDIKNENPTFRYNVSKLQSTLINNEKVENGNQIYELEAREQNIEITVDDILNSNANVTGLNKNDTLDKINTNIFNTRIDENPLVSSSKLYGGNISVVKDSASGKAVLSITALGKNPSNTRKIQVNQTITITGFAKTPNYLLIYGLPIMISLFAVVAAITIILAMKASTKTLKKFIKNEE